MHTVKKHVFNQVFGLFLEAVGSTYQLPVEVWERIWRFTQLPYREKKEDTFRVGTRAKSKADVVTEQERVTDLFASVGDLHMFVFEVRSLN